MSEVTQILCEWQQGAPVVPDRLLPLVYDELRSLAVARMVQERPDHTLQPTALVHEAYMRLVDAHDAQSWDSRGHFFAAAATAMRRILIDWARTKNRAKRGGGWDQVPLDGLSDETVFGSPERLIELDDALSQFEHEDPEAAELVRLRIYTGLSIVEAASVLGISRTTAYDRWQFVVCWFAIELGETS